MSEEKKFTPKSYMEGLIEGTLKGTKCTNCGTPHLPPRHICPACGSRKLEWNTYSGEGVVSGFTEVTVAPAFMAEMVPYKLAVVKLDEGPSITAIVTSKNEISVGDRVAAGYRQGENSATLYFKPA